MNGPSKTYEGLKDKIQESKTTQLDSVIFAGSDYFGDFLEFQKIITTLSHLPRKLGSTLNIIDYDHCILNRFPQLQKSIFQDNRGAIGSAYANTVLGVEHVLDNYILQEYITQRIMSILHSQSNNHQSVILTAGEEKFQTLKLQHSIEGYNGILSWVVPSSEDKPLEFLKIICRLGYIPDKNIIYDDVVKHYLASSPDLVKILESEIIVNELVLSQLGNGLSKQIDHINQNIFIPAQKEI